MPSFLRRETLETRYTRVVNRLARLEAMMKTGQDQDGAFVPPSGGGGAPLFGLLIWTGSPANSTSVLAGDATDWFVETDEIGLDISSDGGIRFPSNGRTVYTGSAQWNQDADGQRAMTIAGEIVSHTDQRASSGASYNTFNPVAVAEKVTTTGNRVYVNLVQDSGAALAVVVILSILFWPES